MGNLNLPNNAAVGFLIEPSENSTFLYCWNGKGWVTVANPRIVAPKRNDPDNPVAGIGAIGVHKKITLDVIKETPSGDVDGYNFIYQLNTKPVVGTEHLYLNGLLQKRGDEADYDILDKTIYFVDPPYEGSVITCSYSSTSYTEIKNEIPVGLIDGENTSYLLFAYPISGTEHVYVNGLLQKEGLLYDYTLLNNMITFNSPLAENDLLIVDYFSNI